MAPPASLAARMGKMEDAVLLDDFMPAWDFRERHDILAAAPPELVYPAAREMDMGRSPLVKPLFRLRELPWRLANRDFESKGFGAGFADLEELGFVSLAQAPPREFVFGAAGRFWGRRPDIQPLDPEGFVAFDRPGHAKVAGNMLVERLGRRTCRLSTETRILCLGREARRGFRRYWAVIRPFSGLIRLEWLRLAKAEAEAAAGCIPA